MRRLINTNLYVMLAQMRLTSKKREPTGRKLLDLLTTLHDKEAHINPNRTINGPSPLYPWSILKFAGMQCL